MNCMKQYYAVTYGCNEREKMDTDGGRGIIAIVCKQCLLLVGDSTGIFGLLLLQLRHVILCAEWLGFFAQ